MNESNVIDANQTHAPPFYRTRTFWILIALMLGALLFRMLISGAMHGHPTDINNFKAWSMHAARHPFREFYKSVNPSVGVWCDYPPLYILVLWVVGKFYQLFDPAYAHWGKFMFTLLVKFPPMLADVGCIGFLFVILKRYTSVSLALFAGFIFAIHPAVWYESALWGQVDSITLLLQLLATWYLIRGQYHWAILATAFNILVKPQGLILLPLVLFLAVYRGKWLQLVLGGVYSLLATFLVTLIFVPAGQIIPWLMNQYMSQADLYAYSSIQAFNVWSFTGMWASDVSRGIFGLGAGAPTFWMQHKTWGLILFSLAYAFCLWFYWSRARRQNTEEGVLIIHTSALIMIAFFLFPTRMHERYLYSGLFFLLGSQVINRRLIPPFWVLSAVFMLNLLYELPGLKRDLNFPAIFYAINDTLSKGGFKFFAALNLLMFVYIAYVLLKGPLVELSARTERWMQRVGEALKPKAGARFRFPVPQALDRKDIWIIVAFLVGSALIKLWRLEMPPEMIFDEVYHARAGGEYVLGMHPFEWVHPPLAKLLIAVGVLMYDLTAIGWRILPVIAGTLLLMVVYLLGRFTLPHRWQAVVATLMLACDGVYFVQSRTAMTNIFATLFQVSALTFTWRYLQFHWHRPRHLHNYYYLMGAGVFIGLSLATRWTSLYSYGFVLSSFVLFAILPALVDIPQLIEQQRLRLTVNRHSLLLILGVGFSLVVIPAIIYLLSYTQYMSLGNSVKAVIDMQKGIWSYHSNLTDPHPYYSAWYTWPWLVRPTWYYFQNHNNGTLSGIIALGNPAIWWASMPVVLAMIYHAITRRGLQVAYLAIACLFMYLPWGMSPRTLNFGHYFFEAVPYACLSTAFLLGVAIDTWGQRGKVLTAVYVSLVCGLFVFFYPIYAGYPISWAYYNLLRWFPSWV
jgi:dolichyl-phosphate-mannose-protein mannosyltransferase